MPSFTTDPHDGGRIESVDRTSFLYATSSGCSRYLGTVTGESIVCQPNFLNGACHLTVMNAGWLERWVFDGKTYRQIERHEEHCPLGPLRLEQVVAPTDALERASALSGRRLVPADVEERRQDGLFLEVVQLGGRPTYFVYTIAGIAGCMPDGTVITRGVGDRYLGTMVGEAIACRPETSFGVCDVDVTNGGAHELWKFDGTVYRRVGS